MVFSGKKVRTLIKPSNWRCSRVQLSGSRDHDPATFTVSDPADCFPSVKVVNDFVSDAHACAQPRETSQVPVTVPGRKGKGRAAGSVARCPRCGTRAFLLSRDNREHRLPCTTGTLMDATGSSYGHDRKRATRHRECEMSFEYKEASVTRDGPFRRVRRPISRVVD